jgi:hypothetical protein
MVGRCLIRPIRGPAVAMHVVRGGWSVATPPEARAVLILPQPREGVRSSQSPLTRCMMTPSVLTKMCLLRAIGGAGVVMHVVAMG